MIRALLIAILALSVNPASAQPLDQLANQSAMIRQHLISLKRKKAVSIYASTKNYCPGFYWSSNTHTYSDNAQRAFLKQVSRQMKSAGFGAAAINHCVENSGFVLENGQLTNHPKNSRYSGRAYAGAMIVRDTKTGKVTEAPMMVETQSYDDKKWAIFDQQFRTACTLTTPSSNSVRLKCGTYGTLDGTSTRHDNGRNSLSVRNARYQMLIETGRPLSYVRNSFKRAFN